jgi:hypothetical protein
MITVTRKTGAIMLDKPEDTKPKKMRFTEAVLDKFEDRFIQGLLGEIEVSMGALDILRRVLENNKRLVVDSARGNLGALLTDTQFEDEEIPQIH